MADQINTISTPDSCTIRQYKTQKRQTTVCRKLTLNPLVLAIIPETALRLIGIQFQALPEVDHNTGTQDTVLNIIYTEGVKGRAIAALRMAN